MGMGRMVSKHIGLFNRYLLLCDHGLDPNLHV